MFLEVQSSICVFYSDAVAFIKSVKHDFSLVAETVMITAVRALPRDAVA